MTNLIPTNLKPLFSNLPKIWLIKPLWTPSGLIAIKVLSSAIVVFVCSNGYFGMEVSMWGKGKGEEEEKKRRKAREGREKNISTMLLLAIFFFSLSSSTSDLQPGRLVGGTARLANRVTMNSVCGTLGAHNGVTEGV